MNVEQLKDHLNQFETRQREYGGHLTALEEQVKEVKDAITKLQGAIEYVTALINQESSENPETGVSENIDFADQPA